MLTAAEAAPNGTMELPLGEASPPGEPEVEVAAPEETAAAAEPPSPVVAVDVPPPAAEAPTTNAEREPDPSLPKRSGWWQRAKATFGS